MKILKENIVVVLCELYTCYVHCAMHCSFVFAFRGILSSGDLSHLIYLQQSAIFIVVCDVFV